MHLVYVDFDGTIVKSNSLHYLIALRTHQLKSQRSPGSLLMWALAWLLLPIILILHKISEPARDRLTYSLYRNLSPTDIDTGGKFFWQKNRTRIFRSQVIALLHVLAAKGYRIIVVSGSLKEMIHPALQACGLDALIDCYLTAELDFGDNLKSRGLKGKANIQFEKVKRIKAYESTYGLSPAARIAITDSMSDLPMLEFCDEAFVVEPKASLKTEALRRSWRILCDPEFPKRPLLIPY